MRLSAFLISRSIASVPQSADRILGCRIYLSLILTLSLLSGCAGKPQLYPVDTTFHGQKVVGDADSEVAKYYIERYRQGERDNPALDDALYRLEAESGIPNEQRLQEITAEFGPDFTAIYLAHRLITDAQNSAMQQRFDYWYAQLMAGNPPPQTLLARDDTAIIFVPGWYYVTAPDSGADFAAQRALLSKHGFQHHMILTEENGVVDDNAEIVAEALKGYAEKYENVLVVSASKGGPETALGLSKLDKNTANIKGWINVGGVLKGSVMADKGSQWPWTWFTKYVVIYGHSLDGVRSLKTELRAAIMEKVSIPPAVEVVNYVGIPMESQVNPRSLGFGMMKDTGPSDGSTYILDAMYPGGITLVEMGIDHYFTHPHIDTKTLALAITLSEMIAAE